MIRDESWPFPQWEIVEITWKEMLERNITQDVLKWLEEYPSDSRYQLRGGHNNDSFKIYFENPSDATMFRIVWAS